MNAIKRRLLRRILRKGTVAAALALLFLFEMAASGWPLQDRVASAYAAGMPEITEVSGYEWPEALVESENPEDAEEPEAEEPTEFPQDVWMNVEAEQLLYDTIEIQWSPLVFNATPVEIDRYELQVKDGDQWVTLKETGDDSDFYYLHTGLEDARFYYYRVYVYDVYGNRSDSFEARASTGFRNTMLVPGANEGTDGLGEHVISEDGQWIAYTSSGDMLPGAIPGKTGLYLYSVASGQLIRIGNANLPSHAGEALAISGNGSYVAYPLYDNDDGWKLMGYNRNTGLVEMLASPGSLFFSLGISRDGSKIVFSSNSPSLTENDTNEVDDAFLVDRSLPPGERVKRISLTPQGEEADEDSFQTVISADGAYAAFVSESLMYLPEEEREDAQSYLHRLYLYHTATGTVEPVRIYRDDHEDDVTWPSLSGDGALIAYRFFVNARGLRIAVYDRHAAENKEIWYVPGSSIVSLQQPYLTSNGRYVALNIENYDWPSSVEPFISHGTLRYDITEESSYRYAGPMNISAATKLSGDGSKGIYAYWDDNANPPGPRLAFLCLDNCDVVAPPEEAVVKADIQFQQQVAGRPAIGAQATIRAVALPGLELQADIELERRDGSGTETTSVALPSTGPGEQSYRAAWKLPEGIKAIYSVRIYPVGHPEQAKEAANLPLEIAGLAHVTLTTQAAAELLQGAKVILWSESAQQGASAAVDATLQAALPIGPNNNYTLKIIDNQSRVLGERKGIAIGAGESIELTINVAPVALLTVYIKGESGKAVDDAIVEVWQKGERIYRVKTAYRNTVDIPGLFYIGDQLEIKVEAPYPYESIESVLYTLEASSQVKELTLIDKEYGTITGKMIYNGKTVSDVDINLFSARGARIGHTVSDAEGNYSFRIPAGMASLSAGKTSEGLYAEGGSLIAVNVDKGGNAEKDVRLTKRGPGTIELKANVQYLDGRTVPIDMANYSVKSRYRLWARAATDSAVNGYSMLSENKFPVTGSPGDVFEVCLNDMLANPDSNCVNVVLDEERKATAEIKHVEAARITGSVVGPVRIKTIYLYGMTDGSHVASQSILFDENGRFAISVPKSGQYLLEIINERNIRIYKGEMEIKQGDQLELAPIRSLERMSFLEGNPGNGYLQPFVRASGGDVAVLRAAYKLPSNSSPLQQAELAIHIPDGAELLPASVMLNGSPATVRADGESKYMLPIGSLSPGTGGNIEYRIRLADSVRDRDLLNSLEIVFQIAGAGSFEERIGTATIRTAPVTLDAPQTVEQSLIKLSGRAAAGKQVLIYADRELIGMANATAGGLWYADVELPQQVEQPIWGGSPQYRITAKVEQDGYYAESSPALVKLDRNAPIIKKVSVTQPGSGNLEFNPQEGVQRLPFIVAPDKYFAVSVEMERTERISNPYITIGGKTESLSKGADGTYSAVLRASSRMDAGIYIGYDLAPEEPVARTGEPSADEWRAELERLGDAWSKMEFSVLDDNPTIAGAVDAAGAADSDSAEGTGPVFSPTYKIVYPDENKSVAHLRMSVQLEKRTGETKPYVGFRNSWDMRTGVLTFKGSVKMSLLTPQQRNSLFKEFPGLNATAAGDPVSLDYVAIGFTLGFPEAEKVNAAVSLAAALKGYVTDSLDFVDYADQLQAFKEMAASNECHSPSLNYFYRQADILYDMAANDLALKSVITGLGLIAGVLPGVPVGITASIGALFTTFNDGVMGAWKERLDGLEQEFKDNKKWRDDMAGVGAIERCRTEEEDPDEKERRKKLADPIWIYDPSGYVYEALPSNRIEGATATLYAEDPELPGAWSEWDAVDYGQRNPLMTDAEGRYAWDVPEGNWKVRYEKAGYQPAESDVLTVLPPHTDVNIPMVSLESPVPALEQAVQGGGLLWRFSKYMIVGTVVKDAIEVETPDGEPVPGQVEAVAAETDPQGRLLARYFRFIPEAVWQAGDRYVLRIRSHVQSYAGSGMVSDALLPFTVLAAAGPAEEAAASLHVITAADGAAVEWERLEGKEAAGYLLTATPVKGDASCTTVELEVKGRAGGASLPGLCAGTTYTFKLQTVTIDGAMSAGITAVASTVSIKRMLPDNDPPGKPAGLKAVWDEDRIQVVWQDPADGDLLELAVTVKEKGNSADTGRVYAKPGEQQALLLGLDRKRSYEITVRAFDKRLNESEPASFMLTVGTDGGGPTGGGTGGPGPIGGDDGRQQAEKADIGAAASKHSFFGEAVELHIPAGAFKNNSVLTVQSQANTTETGSQQAPAFMTRLSRIFKLNAGEKPARSLELIIRMETDQAMDIDVLRKLGLYRRSDSNPAQWVYVGGIFNRQGKYVKADIEEWGDYAIFLYEPDFDDMRSHWGRDAVLTLAARHLLQGKAPGRFAPDQTLTRAEAARLLLALIRAAGWTVAAPDSSDQSQAGEFSGGFSDVAEGAWYAEDVRVAAAMGLVQGNAGRFRPDSPVTRQEWATLLYRAHSIAVQANAMKAIEQYPDYREIAEWARSGIAQAVELGWLQGDHRGTLRPTAGLTRAQAATMLLRILESERKITE